MTPDQLEGVRGALQGVLPEVKLLSDEDVETLHKNYILSPDAVEAADMDLLAGEPDPVPAGLVTLLKACRERERKRKESELQAAKRPKLEADQSEDILKRLLGDPLPAIPSLTELRQYLSEVPQPLPVNRRAYEKLSYRAGADKLVRICKEQDDAVIVVGFSKRVLEDPETAGMEELTGHVVTEMLWEGLRQIQMNLKSPLRLGLVYDKNSSTKGTFSVPNTASKRPDGTGVVKSTLLIAGEEKAESGQLTEAKQDLQTKFTEPFSPLHYGTLDYIISYAASGKHIEFQAMKTRTAEIIPITDVIDFDCPEGKAQLLLVVVNLYRLLLKMKEALPDVHGALEMFKIVERPNGVKIEARQNRIVKTIDDTTNFFKVAGTSYSSIKAAFGAAQASMYVVHAVEGPHLFSALDKYRAVLQPMGCAPTIRSEKQLQQCAHDLVHGLSALHEGGVCHRDVRSPNVILYQDYDGRSRFILIDLESAALSGAQLPPVHFAAWDEYTLVNGKYMPESDLYQLAKMLKELSGHGGVSLSENGKDFIRQLSSKQSSAAALLTHGWLQCVCNKGVEFSQDASL